MWIPKSQTYQVKMWGSLIRMARLWWCRFATRATWIVTIRIIWKIYRKNIRIKNCDKKKQIYAKLGQTNEPLSDASLQKKTNEKENVPLFGQPQNGSGLKHPKTERNHNIFAFDGKIYIHNAFVELHHIFDPFLFITLPNEPKRSRKMKWSIVGQHSNSYIESDSLSSLMHNIYLNRHTAAYNHINRRTRRATGSKKH